MIGALPRHMNDGFGDGSRLPHVEPTACRALWCGVLALAWQDALRPVSRTHGCEAFSAQQWFGSADFFRVCLMAGIDGDQVLAAYREARRGAAPEVPA